jgi:DNA-binding transcriptional LysR family regulator
MDFSQLRTLLLLAREGNMTRSAAKLHLTQPAVSAQLARLEDEVGQRLFDRTPKGMVLTESGRVFCDFARAAIEKIDEGKKALASLDGLERGSVRIGGGATATTYLLPPLLGRFLERYPSIKVFVREESSQAVVTSVLEGELDLGIVTLPIQDRYSSRICVENWVRDELYLLVPPGHRLAGRKGFAWPDLEGTPLVLFQAGSSVRNILDQRLFAAAIDADVVMELRSIESIKQMVAQGIGAAFVSRFALSTGSTHLGLRCREAPIDRRLAIITHAERSPSRAAAALLEELRSAALD